MSNNSQNLIKIIKNWENVLKIQEKMSERSKTSKIVQKSKNFES